MLFNDRYGLHRLYYHESSEAFYFGAEAKAILSVRPELRRLEPRAFGEFVSCGCVLENRTLFQGVYVLPAAAKWRFDHGSLTERSNYFHPSEWEGQDPLDPEAYYQAILEVFSRNLPRYFAGPHKIGLSLTGGLDTRMIMAWHKAAANAFPCYTFGGMVRDSQDVRVARQVARICQQPHQVIRVDEKFLRDFSYYAERTVYLTDGCADVSRSADLYINQIARQIAPVRMTGNYGGEVMRSVRAFKPMNPMQELYDPEVLSRTKEATQTYADLIRIHPLSFAAFRQIPWHHYGLFALERTQISLRSPYLDNDFVRTLFRAPQSEGTNNDICLRLVRDGNEPLSRLPTDRGVGRAGFLQAVRRTALEFQFKAEYAYDYGMPHWAVPFDRLLSGLHPEQVFLGRHKFAHYRLWYRKILSGYVQEVLLDRRSLSRPHIQRKAVEALVNGHLKGVKNYTSEIHKLLTAELLCRSLLDSKPARVSDPM
jgi:asparagine synthase (glutamine-hydrolysing)